MNRRDAQVSQALSELKQIEKRDRDIEGTSWTKLVEPGQAFHVLRAKVHGRNGITIYIRPTGEIDREEAGNTPTAYRNTATIRYRTGAIWNEMVVELPYRGYSDHFVCDEIEAVAAVHIDSEYAFFMAGGFYEGNVRQPVQQYTWTNNDYGDPVVTIPEILIAPFTKEIRVATTPWALEGNEDGLFYLIGAQGVAGSDLITGRPALDLTDWTPLPHGAVYMAVLADNADMYVTAQVR